MNISDNLLKFLRDPENQALINEGELEDLYEQAFHQSYYSWIGFKVGDLTEVLYDSGIDPLIYLDRKIPKGFLQGSRRKSFEIPGYIDSIGDEAFSKCDLVDMVIPTNVKSLGNNVFFGCMNLTSMVIPDSVTNIGVSTFAACQSLENITLSKNMTTIKEFMFESCFKLADVVIPGGIVKIEKAAFKSCTNLTRVVIPDSVTHIEQDVFKGCGSLKHIYYKGTWAQWREIKKPYNWGPPTSATIHCSDIDIYS